MQEPEKINKRKNSLCCLMIGLLGWLAPLQATAQDLSFVPNRINTTPSWVAKTEKTFGELFPPRLFSIRSALLYPYQNSSEQQPFLPAHQQAFFCRVEWEWEKTTALPFKFRLGSVEYVDYLEGKQDY